MLIFAKGYIEEISKLTDKNIYLAGSSIRDYFIKKEIANLHIVTLEDTMNIIKKFKDMGKVSLISFAEGNKMSQVIFKSDNMEKPDIYIHKIEGKDIYEYLSKKDFTINALAVKIQNGKIDFNNVIDPYGGLEDIKNKIIREINENIFDKDPMGMLRVVRLMAQLNFDISDKIYELINRNNYRIKEIPGEKLRDELFRILGFKRAYYYFGFMDKHLGILSKIFPEIEPMKEVGKCKYHVVDAWTHSLHTMRVIEKIIYADGYFEKHLKKAYEEHTGQIMAKGHTRIQLIKLAALFHDIGKPRARWVDETGRVRFRGHEIVGGEIMADISDRLGLSKKEKKFLCKIVREHMWPLTLYKTNDVSGRALYDLFKNFGEITLDIILIGLADIISTRQLLKPHEEMGMYKVHAEYLANNYLTRFKRLEDISGVINEDDILKNFHIEDKQIINHILDSVKRAIFFGEIPLERGRILSYIEDRLL